MWAVCYLAAYIDDNVHLIKSGNFVDLDYMFNAVFNFHTKISHNIGDVLVKRLAFQEFTNFGNFPKFSYKISIQFCPVSKGPEFLVNLKGAVYFTMPRSKSNCWFSVSRHSK